MTFKHKHKPQYFDELVFSNPANERTLRQYADGIRTEHLIIHGPYGSGKSTAARVIGLELARKHGISTFNERHNGRTDDKRTDWSDIHAAWQFQRFFEGMPGYVVVDEIDFYSQALRKKLLPLLNCNTPGTLVMTTNNLHALNYTLIACCTVVNLTVPAGISYSKRALSILKAEGFEFTREDIEVALSQFDGSFRDLEKFLENFVEKQSIASSAAQDNS